MDIVREIVVREALFVVPNQVLGISPGGNLSYRDVESLLFGEERIVFQQTRGRGIHKPTGLTGALSINSLLDS